ncbi:MAG TPA: PQQ-binding-like beta-propeller repeat protein [Gaiellales bacterium]
MTRSALAAVVCAIALWQAAIAANAFAATRAACPAMPGRSLVLISARTGAVDRDFPDVSANAVVSDGHGGWFVAGSFSCVGGVHVPGLVRLDHHGRLDRGWHAVLPRGRRFEGIAVLVRAGPTLYAGGTFGIEALAASNGARRWLAPVTAPSTGAGVEAIAAGPGRVFVGGDYGSIAGSRRHSLAALDPATGHVLAWRYPVLKGFVPSPSVEALAVAGRRLYLGGTTITRVDGARRPGLAAFDAISGRLSSWTPGTAPGLNPGYGVGDVETILVSRDTVITAGHDGFGAVSARTGRIEPWMRRLQGVAYRFASYGGTLYLGGNVRNSFSAAGAYPRDNLAAVDPASGRFTAWGPRLARFVGVSSMAADRDEVLVAGSFTPTLG